MRVAKWGNSLAVRLPADLVKELGLQEGDVIELTGSRDDLAIRRHRRADEVLADIRRFRGRLPTHARLSREEAHER